MGEAAKNTDTAQLWLVDVAKGRSFALRDGFVVGRGEGDVRILDPAVSTKHCVFHQNGALLEIEDLGSRNGTLVNGRKLEAKSRVPVSPGMRIEIGSITFAIHAGEPPKESGRRLELASTLSLLEPEASPVVAAKGDPAVARAPQTGSRTMPRPWATDSHASARKQQLLAYALGAGLALVVLAAWIAWRVLRR